MYSRKSLNNANGVEPLDQMAIVGSVGYLIDKLLMGDDLEFENPTRDEIRI